MLTDVDLLAHLVAYDTTSHRSNLEIVDFIADYLDRPGVEILRQPAPEEPKANLVVRVGSPRGDGAGLVLSAHTDVVPATEPEWRSDPFTLTSRGDQLVGRGAADMKGFLALAMNRAAALDPDRLVAPLVLLITYDEELGTLGAAHLHRELLGSLPVPARAVVGEPTELEVVEVHKGHVKLRFEIEGRSAHSAYPDLGHNAIEAAGRLVVALAELRTTLAERRPDGSRFFREAPSPTLNIGTIHGGSAINIVPDRTVVEVGRRLLPGEDPSDAVAEIESTAAAALRGERWRVEPLALSPALGPTSDGNFRRLVLEATGRQTTSSVAYATDAGWLARSGIDCLVWGPGSIRVAHRPNEAISRRDLEAAVPPLDRIIAGCCLRASIQ